MPEPDQELIYECGKWQIHLGRRELLADGVAMPLGARAFEILELLVQSANVLVTKHDLMDRIWPGAVVGENTLHVHISAIRAALGKDRAMLRTVAGRGYLLLSYWTTRSVSGREEPLALTPVRESIPAIASNLPMAVAELIGRAEALRQIQDLLPAHRVVTLAGPGGVGKTALALEACRGSYRGFGGAIVLVDLASLPDARLVPSAAVDALGLEVGGDQMTPESVARAIGDRKLLLILDNCEHVIDAAADLAETLIRLCSRTSVLATSREPLRIAGECVYRVPPLEVPPWHWDKPGDVLEYSAVQLFVARIQALDSTFPANAESVRSIAAICQRLDGIPLAIEFAAARAAVLGVQYVASHLADRFRLLASGRRMALPRHQTLRATVDWSYDLLPETEQRLLRRLAIFAAGFTLEAAISLMHDTAGTVVVECIANLVQKSLVILDRSAASGRLSLLETIRAYALEKLEESGEAEAIAWRHAMFCRSLPGPAGGSWSRRPSEEKVLQGRETGSVRVALNPSFSVAGDPAIGVILRTAHVPGIHPADAALSARNGG